MRAAVLFELPGSVSIEDVEIDKPRGREVLVRTAAAGLCHTDLHVMKGHFPGMPMPMVLGHESAGVVESVGELVTRLAPGDHVVTCISMFCGECEFCLAGRPALCMREGMDRTAEEDPRLTLGGSRCLQHLALSAFAEKMLVHENSLVRIPEEMPLDRAAVLGCAVTTGVGAVLRTARIEAGTAVAVIGCGGVGLNCIQAARLAGARRIVAIDRVEAKLDLAKTFGATDVLNSSEVDIVAAIKEMFPIGSSRGGPAGGVDYAFEAIGLKATTEQAFQMVRKGGTATVVGAIPYGVNIEIAGLDLLMEKKLQGSLMGSNRFRYDIPHYVELYLQGRLKLDELISARIDLSEVNDGFGSMERGEVARSVVVL